MKLPKRLKTGALAALLAAPASLFAEPRTWDGGAGAGDTSWQNSLNWNPDGVPTSTSDVLFTNTGIPVFGLIVPLSGTEPANSVTFSMTRALTLDSPVASINLTSGDVTRQDVAGTEQNVLMNCTVRMLADGLWNIDGSGMLSVRFLTESGGARSLSKTGNGLLEIQSAGYTGPTIVSQGTLRLEGLVTSNISVASGATLQTQGAALSAVTLSGVGVAGLGALRNVTSGNTGLVTLASDGVVISSDSGPLQLNGITDGASSFSWTKAGAGTVELFGSGTYEGNTLVSEGTLIAHHTAALGTGRVIVSPGATIGVAAPNVTNPITLGGALAAAGPDGSSYKGVVTLTGNATLSGDFSLDIAGTITDNGQGFNITKTGLGTISISGTNAVSGTFTVSQGMLSIVAPPPSTAPITVQNTGTLLFDNLAIDRPLHLSGPGSSFGLGALFGTGQTNAWLGPITLDGDSSVGNMIIRGAITGNFGLTCVANGNVTLTNPANNFASLTIAGGAVLLSSSAVVPATSPITLMPNTQLNISGSSVYSQPLRLASFVSFAGPDNTWAGPITLLGDAFLAVNPLDHLTVSGNITGPFSLNLGLPPEFEHRYPGEISFSGSNSYGDTHIFEGMLTALSGAALPAGKTVNLDSGATLQLANNITTSALLLLNGRGFSNLAALFSSQGDNTITGSIKLVTDTTIGTAASSTLTLSGVLSDDSTPLPLVKLGLGTLVLSANNTYRGGTFANGGTLSISSNANLGDLAGEVTLNNGGKLLITANTTSARTFNLNSGSIQVNQGVTFSYNNATVTGGFLRGPGTHAITGVASFSGVTALAGTNITQSASTTLNNFTNAGNLVNFAPLVWDGGFNTAAGSFTISNTANLSGFENTGSITVNNGGALNNSGNNLTSGGGGRITINPGAQLNLGSTSLDLNGSLLINNGTITGTTNINFGALAKGSGVYGPVNVTDGGKFSPGNSPGTVTTGSTTWNSGGSYLVEIGDMTHDFWLIDGLLNLNASPQHSFTISLASIDGLIFDNTRDYSWPILHASAGIVEFDPAALALDISNFNRNLGAGHFYLETTPSDVIVNFSSVPETGMAGALIVAACCTVRRTRRQFA